ncbi:hypothetical protein L226DRAFT_121828 [Lentinus tigrinus ALCF2SS1-7]|uniref:uncharacterized protein n=1 Tax=Lentinus tigrinus ALCF2SS1-7 TaxID=1328758 RepID=UPI0011661187|nr:hypothetical protein L226DRAFT_121828 [Lentinus tigrinus ALCF2SS1-7]
MNANFEEAANIATEYLSSLENLPNEAQHILIEIRHRETKTQDLAEEIRKETQKYFRHSQKNAGQPLPAKDAAIPEIVNGLYAQVDVLAAEKVALATRLVKLLERAMARLQHDLQKILKLQGEEPGLPPTQHFLNSVDSTMQQLQSSLRSAAAAVEPPPAAAPAAPPPQKKRRVTAAASAGSIKLPSPVPVSNSGYNSSSGTQKSSLSRVHPRHSPVRQRRGPASTGLEDEDAEGEEDEEGADVEDQKLYCYCQKRSYGEMIGCDNESCPLQWFHLSCVNLTPENLPQTWYCDECSAQLGLTNTSASASSGGRKGRKK